MRKLILSFLISLFSIISYAQNVSGVVSEASTGEPLPGVSVVIKNTTIGAETDFDGKFNLKAANGATLVFSSLGYKTQEVTVTGNVINVSLQEDSETLDEVVVIG